MTPEQENELICEKLLGLSKHVGPDNELTGIWGHPSGMFATPTFLEWDFVGLILEAFAEIPMIVNLNFKRGTWTCELERFHPNCLQEADTGPLAIRAMALKWLELQAILEKDRDDTKAVE